MKYQTHEQLLKNYHESNHFDPTVQIAEGVEIGQNNHFGPFCIIGGPAEHKSSWNPAESGRVSIGDGNILTGLDTLPFNMCVGVPAKVIGTNHHQAERFSSYEHKAILTNFEQSKHLYEAHTAQ